MKYNAFSTTPVILHKVWADPDDPPFITVPAGVRLFVLWSPTLQQWIASISHIDYRYDAILSTTNFVLDSSLLPVEAQPEKAETYYLNRLKFIEK